MSRSRCLSLLVSVGIVLTGILGETTPTSAGVVLRTTHDCETQRTDTAMFGCEESIDKDLAGVLNHDLAHIATGFNSSQARRAQSSWTNYLETECTLVWDFYYPGTVAAFEKAKCQVELTQDRINELQPLVNPETHS